MVAAIAVVLMCVVAVVLGMEGVDDVVAAEVDVVPKAGFDT